MGLHLITATNKYNIRDRISDCYEYDKKVLLRKLSTLNVLSSVAVSISLYTNFFPQKTNTKKNNARKRHERKKQFHKRT